MDYERAYGWKGNTFNESEMALFSECMLQCARKVLDTADIVREAWLHKLWEDRRLPEQATKRRCGFNSAPTVRPQIRSRSH